MGGELPKQFLSLGGRRVVEWSVDAMERSLLIGAIEIVVNPDYRDLMEKIAASNGWRKVERIVDGGRERNESVRNAVKALGGENVNVLVHDAARPLISQAVIERVCNALLQHGAVGVAIPMVDTVWKVKSDIVTDAPDRKELWRAQTPQGFRLDVLREAHLAAAADPNFEGATDDCGLVRHYVKGIDVFVVKGEQRNLKLTYPTDLDLLERLIDSE